MGIGSEYWKWGTVPGLAKQAYDYMFPDPAAGAQKYLGQMGQKTGQYMDPYIQAGLGAEPILQQQYGELTADPGAKLAQMGSEFKASPGYQYNVQQATEAAKQAAAAGGMAGSPESQQELAKSISGMASQDYGNYMQRAMGMYGRGLQGEQGLYGTGFQASSEMARAIQQMLGEQAQLSYAGQATQEKGFGALLGQGIGAVAGAF